MRTIREITAEEENFRVENVGLIAYGSGGGGGGASGVGVIKRDAIEPEPVGTIIFIPFLITGYDKDCDGSLMARLEGTNLKGELVGWEQNNMGLYPDTAIVLSEEELRFFI